MNSYSVFFSTGLLRIPWHRCPPSPFILQGEGTCSEHACMPVVHASATWVRRLARPLARLGTLPGRGPAWQPPQEAFTAKAPLTGIDIPDKQGFA